jgi:hypothetical protein
LLVPMVATLMLVLISIPFILRGLATRSSDL